MWQTPAECWLLSVDHFIFTLSVIYWHFKQLFASLFTNQSKGKNNDGDLSVLVRKRNINPVYHHSRDVQWNQLSVDVSTHRCCFSSSSTAHCSSLDLLSSNSSVTCREEQHVRTPAAGGGHKNSLTYFLFPLTPPQKQTQQLNVNDHWFNTNCRIVNSSTPTSFVFNDACLYFTFYFPSCGINNG